MTSEVGIETARARLGDYVNAAMLTGATTIITRNGRAAARIAPLEDTVTTTTEYGTWAQVAISCNTVEASVGDYLGEFAPDFDVPGLVAAYRSAIDDALPEGISLCGNNFYGPYPQREDAADLIREAFESVNLDDIASKYATAAETD